MNAQNTYGGYSVDKANARKPYEEAAVQLFEQRQNVPVWGLDSVVNHRAD